MKNEVENTSTLVPSDIRPLIYEIRGVQVMLDRDLAALYQVQTKVLNQAVKRNANRFPTEYCFRLTDPEMEELVTNCDRFAMLKHSSVPMAAFTEQGVAMLSAVLKSKASALLRVLSASALAYDHFQTTCLTQRHRVTELHRGF